MAVGLGEGAEIRKPMAITVIGGVAVASFFTLLVIPVIYSLLDRKRFEPA
jgi:HAE1 family hydrophobic/amphiphilic exporter-1